MRHFFEKDELNLEDNLSNLSSSLQCASVINITPTCNYDYKNYLIYTEGKEYLLTKRENLFLKLLIQKRGTLSYFEMDEFLSCEDNDFTINAKRLFVKNFRKKIPKKILRNISEVGYRLIF